MVENLVVPLWSLEYARGRLWLCDIGTLALSRPHLPRDTCKQMEITQHGNRMWLAMGGMINRPTLLPARDVRREGTRAVSVSAWPRQS